MLQDEERASANVEYQSEKFNITIKESRIRLGQRNINVSFGGPPLDEKLNLMYLP